MRRADHRLAPAPDRGGGGDATRTGSMSPSGSSSRTSRKIRSTSAAIRMLAELAARIGRLTGRGERCSGAPSRSRPASRRRRPISRWCSGGWGGRPKRWRCSTSIFAAEPEGLGHRNLQGGDARPARRLRAGASSSTSRCSSSAPDQPRVLLSYGHMLKTLGRQTEGIAAYRRAIELEPTLGEAWWSLANLKTVRFDEADMAAMEAALGSPDLNDDDRFHLEFALGKALHDARRAATTPLPIMRAATRFGATTIRSTRGRHDGSSTAASQLFTADVFAERRRLRSARPDLHRRHAAGRIDPGRADPVVATARSKGRPSCPTLPALARERGRLSASAVDLDGRAARRSSGEEYLKRAGVQRRTDRPVLHRQAAEQLAVRARSSS